MEQRNKTTSKAGNCGVYEVVLGIERFKRCYYDEHRIRRTERPISDAGRIDSIKLSIKLDSRHSIVAFFQLILLKLPSGS